MKILNAGTMEIVKKVDPVHSAGTAAHAVDKDSLMEKDAQAQMAAITITVVSLIPIPLQIQAGFHSKTRLSKDPSPRLLLPAVIEGTPIPSAGIARRGVE